jgi:hypothetical protein
VIRRSLRFVIVAGFIAGSSVVRAQAPAPAPAQPAAPATFAPNDYTDEKTWLCRPGRKGDACDVDLTTTVIAADGTMTREAFAADPKAPIDCFYVYPTVATDPGVNSDMNPDPAEINVVLQQFARFSSQCRPFAPVYRQVTLAGLRTRLGGGATTFPFESGVQYTDVRDAWQSYLKNDNRGRGFILVGHSQGSYILEELIKQEIDGKPIQKRLVGAYLLGATLLTPAGKDVGGQFKSIPLCRKPGQIGCVVNFSSFRSTIPPPGNTLFGHSEDAAMSGSCTNPAALTGGAAPLHAYLSTKGTLIVGNSAAKPWVADKTVDTPFVSVPGLLTAQCKKNEFATYLEITVNGDPADPRVDDITGDLGGAKPLANWGLHLVDVNLVMGNLLELAGAQSKAYRVRK